MTDLGHETDEERYRVEIVDDTVAVDARPEVQNAVAQRGPQVPGWLWALGGLGLVVLVIMITAQPSQPPAEPTPTTVPSPATFVPPTSAPDPDTEAEAAIDEPRFEALGPPATLAPLEAFAGTVPDDLPGELLTFGPKGRLVVVDRALDAPFEIDTGIVNVLSPRLFASPEQVVIGTGSRTTTLDGPLREAADWSVPVEGNLQGLFPGSFGRFITTTSHGTDQTASPLVLGGIQQWDLPVGVDVIGEWDGRLLIEAAGRILLVDTSGAETELAGVGRILAYDGHWLAHVTCQIDDGCRVNLGTPEDPSQRSMPVPEPLAVRPADEWGRSAAISADGLKVAVSRDGGAPIPMVLHFDTDETRILADGMNTDSPMVFSPDGEWLAYAFQNDVTVWRIDGDRSWRIGLGRPVGALAWR
ncbi:MAG: hypothetical protein GY929_11720 [Actinomycetia bacterium]|nr:hypothetical protein [Actinomycetes bacterium]